jgi:Zn-dependent peptidase ImmA (M78 family)
VPELDHSMSEHCWLRTLIVGSCHRALERGDHLNSSHTGGRPASDLTHELAHKLCGHKPARIDVSEDGLLMLSTYDATQEEEAAWLCGCLLLPRDAVLSIRRRKLNLRKAATYYGVSV